MKRYQRYDRLLSLPSLIQKAGKKFVAVKKRIPYRKTVVFLQKRPFTSFFAALGILLLLIVLGSILRSLGLRPEKKIDLIKSVQTYNIKRSPTVTVQATVEKFGVVQIVAQTSGIVDKVTVNEGQLVTKGTTLIYLSSSYAGANAPAVQAQIANEQYKNIVDTYDTQKGLIATERDLAKDSRENSSQLRDIAQRSIGDTSELLRYSENMLNLVNQTIGNTPSDPQDTQFSNPLQAQRSQLLATVVQVRSQLRSTEQQADTNKAPNKLADLQENAALKQLDLQEKALDLQKETSRLQSALAGINASLMRPSTPFAGVVQRIFVRPGQTVNPGTPLAVVTQSEHTLRAVASVPYEIASGVSVSDESELVIGNKRLSLRPSFVSTDATDGQLYSIKYEIPLAYEKQVTDLQSIAISVPVRFSNHSGSGLDGSLVPFIPLDSVYQTQNESSVFLVQNGKAVAKKVTLGDVFGRFVKVESGLSFGDSLILSRNVIENDKVKPY